MGWLKKVARPFRQAGRYADRRVTQRAIGLAVKVPGASSALVGITGGLAAGNRRIRQTAMREFATGAALGGASAGLPPASQPPTNAPPEPVYEVSPVESGALIEQGPPGPPGTAQLGEGERPPGLFARLVSMLAALFGGADTFSREPPPRDPTKPFGGGTFVPSSGKGKTVYR